MNLLRLAATGLASLVLSAAAAAATTVTFSGTVTTGFGSIASGSALTGTLSYDENAPISLSLTPILSVFNALTSLDFTVGGYSASLPSTSGASEVQLDDGPGVFDLGGGFVIPINDRLLFRSGAASGLVGSALDGTAALQFFNIRLDDSTNAAFNTAGSLPSSLALSSFDSRLFFIDFEGGTVSGTIDALRTVAAVPIPATLPLLVCGVGLLGWAGRRRRTT